MDVNERNMRAVEQQLRDLGDRVYSQQERIDNLVRTVADLQARLIAMESSMATMRAQVAGRGPTV